MQRREFCKVIASAAAATAVPAVAQTQNAAQLQAFNAYNTYTEDYAKFCATPAGERVFYALENGQLVTKKAGRKDLDSVEGRGANKIADPWRVMG